MGEGSHGNPFSKGPLLAFRLFDSDSVALYYSYKDTVMVVALYRCTGHSDGRGFTQLVGYFSSQNEKAGVT